MTVEGLVLRRWKRYGHDRTYVTTASGASLGYRDNVTNVVVVDDEAFLPAVEQVLGGSPVVPTAPVSTELPSVAPEPYAVTVDRLAADLAANRAGESARAKAAEHRAAAPVRTFVTRLLGVHTDERAWRVGARGEQIVGEELELLSGRGWHIVHDVPVGDRGANIDHVAVGPGGVFTVNSKYHWGGRVWVGGNAVKVNGQSTDYVRKASYEAKRASRLLGAAWGQPVAVVGLLAIVCQNRVVKSQPPGGDVLIMGPRETRTYLERLPGRLSVEQVERLAYLARRSTTWQPSSR